MLPRASQLKGILRACFETFMSNSIGFYSRDVSMTRGLTPTIILPTFPSKVDARHFKDSCYLIGP